MFYLLWVWGDPSLDGLLSKDLEIQTLVPQGWVWSTQAPTQVPGICRAVLSTEEAVEMTKLCADSGRRRQHHLVIPASRNLCLSSTTDSGVSQALPEEDLGAALMEGRGGAWKWATGN